MYKLFMKIIYDLETQSFAYEQNNKLEISKLNFLLSNNRGDFINFGVLSNSCKFQGASVYGKNGDIYKFIDEILVLGMKADAVVYGGYFARRDFASDLVENTQSDIKDEKWICIQRTVQF